MNVTTGCTMGANPLFASFLIIDRTSLQATDRIFVDFYNLVSGDTSASGQWATSFNSNQSASYI